MLSRGYLLGEEEKLVINSVYVELFNMLGFSINVTLFTQEVIPNLTGEWVLFNKL